MSLSLRYCGSHPPPWQTYCKGPTLPVGVIRFIVSWYQSQQVWVRWKAMLSEPFSVTRWVWQGCLVSPIWYIDDLLMELAESGVGCHWNELFVGALAYADSGRYWVSVNVLVLLTPWSSILIKHSASDSPDVKDNSFVSFHVLWTTYWMLLFCHSSWTHIHCWCVGWGWYL